MKLFTIGYEGATQADVIARLKTAGVQTLVDVRAVAASRRAGFSKTILGESLKAEGIGYVHLRGLGTPKAASARSCWTSAGGKSVLKPAMKACLTAGGSELPLMSGVG